MIIDEAGPEEKSDDPYTGKDIYLKRGDEILGLHATMFDDQQMEAFCNAYDVEYKWLGSIFRIFGPIEETAQELKDQGFVVVPPPPPKAGGEV